MVPHPSKRDKGGEDAFVAAHDLMVVADGVGGWARQGVDPGLFSK
jgi:protein phosphatase PTC7